MALMARSSSLVAGKPLTCLRASPAQGGPSAGLSLRQASLFVLAVVRLNLLLVLHYGLFAGTRLENRAVD